VFINHQKWGALEWVLTYRYCILANWAPALPRKYLMSLRYPSGHFTLHKVFSPVTHLGFGVWVGEIMLVLRTFPELVGRSVQNLVEIGPAVRAWKGNKQSLIYIYRRNREQKGHKNQFLGLCQDLPTADTIVNCTDSAVGKHRSNLLCSVGSEAQSIYKMSMQWTCRVWV